MEYNKKGISLIGIIITVLIMAILAAVMIPSGIDKINDAKLTSFNDKILTLKQEVSAYFMKNDEYPTKTDGSSSPVVYSITGNFELVAEATKKGDQNDTFYIIDLDKIKIDNKDTGVGKTIDDYYIVAKTSGNVYYAKGNKIGNITYYTKQNKGDGVVAVVPTGGLLGVGTPNPPKLSTGMTAVKWNGSAWENADIANVNNDWYDYTRGVNKWANAKLADGSLFVWIPRYTYKILSGEHSSTAGDITINFSSGTIDDTTNGYRIQPAFYWGGWNIPDAQPSGEEMSKQAGGTELTGIWVGKFETSDDGTGKIKIDANKTSGIGTNVSNVYTLCRGMQTTNASTYGLSPDSNVIDTHMMKNSEWGATAYLSKYALGATKVERNLDANITANGDIVVNKAQSTTGNEYGIFDMNGCRFEYLASYINNNDPNIMSDGALLASADGKYKNVFPKAATDDSDNNYAAASKTYGHALYETSPTGLYVDESTAAWFGVAHNFPKTTYPFFIRGFAGIFDFYYDSGPIHSNDSFRVSIAVP